jgi:hypothetical protein
MRTNSLESTQLPLEVTLLAKSCADNGCPAVYLTNRGTLVIQGYQVSAQEIGIELPPNEFLVEIPSDLLPAASPTAD